MVPRSWHVRLFRIPVNVIALQAARWIRRERRLCVSNCQFSRRIQDWATLRSARRLTYADSRMKNLRLTLLHLAVMTAKLCGPVACER
jgi:hypothetical protein